ncbi:MAG: NAD(P)/FAD-dependent oxidoreductase, partial [Defluviitaleaceae bacterium]|nr:NAD(P)/FAD-dependent oxidoreductase [Defluviitaleaceae bacterium]
IGIEMASYFASAGSVVVVIEMLGTVGGPVDRDISGALLGSLRKKGITVELDSRVESVSQNNGRVALEISSGTKKSLVEADKALFSIGRRPFAFGAGLDTIGVEFDKSGVKTDGRMRTNVSGVYAAGDVTGRMMLAHVAYRQAEVAVSDMRGCPVRGGMRYDSVPSVIYAQPESAAVGLTEQGAIESGIDYFCAKVPMAYSGRYLAENEGDDGFCKIIADKKTERILGVHMIGGYSSEIILRRRHDRDLRDDRAREANGIPPPDRRGNYQRNAGPN